MPAYLPSQFIFKAFDNNGLPLSGGQLFTYQSGTSIPLATYTDATGLTQKSNPIILDAYGQATIWLSSNLYRFNLLDANSVQMPAPYPIDNVSSASGSPVPPYFSTLTNPNNTTATIGTQGAYITNSTAANLTNLTPTTGNTSGQLTIMFGDTNTTLINGSSAFGFHLKGATNYNPTTAGCIMTFLLSSSFNGCWNEASRSF